MAGDTHRLLSVAKKHKVSAPTIYAWRKHFGEMAPSDVKRLRALEAEYCSWGDTVHYLDHPKFFDTCEGSYMYDAEGRAFLDLVALA